MITLKAKGTKNEIILRDDKESRMIAKINPDRSGTVTVYKKTPGGLEKMASKDLAVEDMKRYYI